MAIFSKPRIRRIAVDGSALIAWFLLYVALVWANRVLGLAEQLVTADGFSTLLQVLPSIIIALYAAAFGSLFVVAQIIAPSRGQRSVRMLLLEPRLRAMVAGTVLVTVLAVLLAGQAPGAGNGATADPQPLLREWLPSAAAALAELVALVVVAFTVLLAQLFHWYGSPTDFRTRLVGKAERHVRYLEEASKVFRQWICTAARDGASRDVKHACGAAEELTAIYVEKTDEDFRRKPPSGRIEVDAGVLRGDISTMDGWFGDQLGRALVRAIEETARADGAWRNLDHMLKTHSAITAKVLEKGFKADALLLIQGLVEVGCMLEQTDSERLTRWFRTRPLETLVSLDETIHERMTGASTGAYRQALEAAHQGCVAAWCYLLDGVEAGSRSECPHLAHQHDDTTWDGAKQALETWCQAPPWSLRCSSEPAAVVFAGRARDSGRQIAS